MQVIPTAIGTLIAAVLGIWFLRIALVLHLRRAHHDLWLKLGRPGFVAYPAAGGGLSFDRWIWLGIDTSLLGTATRRMLLAMRFLVVLALALFLGLASIAVFRMVVRG